MERDLGTDIYFGIEYRKRPIELSEVLRAWEYNDTDSHILLGHCNKLVNILLTYPLNTNKNDIGVLRGLPNDISDGIFNRLHTFLDDKDERFLEKVEKWNELGWIIRKTRRKDNKQYVSNPEFGCESWCTAGELETALKLSNMYFDEDCKKILGVMRELEKKGNECRMIYWFDNKVMRLFL